MMQNSIEKQIREYFKVSIRIDPKNRSLDFHPIQIISEGSKSKDHKENSLEHKNRNQKSLTSINISNLKLILITRNDREILSLNLIKIKMSSKVNHQKRGHLIS